MRNKVPEITLYFWIIKIMATTVGETFADFLNVNLGFGLSTTSYVMGALLLGVLCFQFAARSYVPGVYWTAIVFISVVGTLITDNLTDSFGVPLVTSTAIFGVLLAVTFAAWFAIERTLSIHSIVTSRREGFYWLTILFTFALGTAAGEGPGESPLLDPLLETCDSVMTYRRRHFSRPQLDGVIELIFHDPSNPRSTAYQIAVLDQEISRFSGDPEFGLLPKIREHLQALDLRFSEPPAPDFAAFSRSLETFADMLTQHYFSHSVRRVY